MDMSVKIYHLIHNEVDGPSVNNFVIKLLS